MDLSSGDYFGDSRLCACVFGRRGGAYRDLPVSCPVGAACLF